VKDNLVPFEKSQCWSSEHTEIPSAPSEEPCFSVKGLITNQNAKVKKTKYLLFVNSRPVQCTSLKSSIEAIVGSVHAKSFTYWAFLDVRMPYEHVDVNIHPTKSEVMFLFEAELVELIRRAVEDALDSCQAVRTLVKDSVAQAPKPTGTFYPFSTHSFIVCTEALVKCHEVSI
jgi:DNA mismatch repair protein MLH1